MIQVTGTLLDPLGRPIPEAIIRLTAEVSEGSTPEASFSLYETDSNGFYDFNVDDGRYTLEINSTDEFCLNHTVIVDDATPTPVNLIEWVQYATPIVPPVIVPGTPNWEDLHENLRNDVDTTSRTKVDVLSDGTDYVNTTKELLDNPRLRADMAQETIEAGVGTAKGDTQINTYGDVTNNQSVQVSTVAVTDNSKVEATTELYKASSGNVNFEHGIELDSPNTKYSESVTASDEDTTHNIIKSYSGELGDSSVSGVERINETDANKRHELTTASGGVTHESIINPAYTYEHTEVEYGDGNAYSRHSSIPAVAQHSIGAIKGGREAKHSVDSEGSYTHVISQADYIINKDNDGDEVIKVDTIRKEVTLNAKLILSNPDDFKGDTGDTIFEVFQYSQDNGVTDGWHYTFNPAVDYWRRQNTSVNGYIDPLGWSDGMLLIAQDGLPGDTLYWDYKYSSTDDLPDPYNPTATLWHDDLETGDIYRIECKVVDGVYQLPWSNPARIRGLDGVDGNIVELEYSYSTDGVTGTSWHFNFTTGDHFRRERYIFFHTQAERDAYVPVTNETFFQATPWNNVAQIVPINGIDYGVKQTTVYLYQRGTTEPAPPSGDLVYDFDTLGITPTANLNGWEVGIPAGTGNIYVAIAVASALQTSSDPITPAEWNISQWSAAGFNQSTITLYQKVPIGDPDPVPPTNVLTYDFATRDFVPPYDLEGWSQTIPAGTDKLWGCIASAFGATPTDTIQPSEWYLSDQGAVGLNQANMVIYQRSATQPPAPSATATYDFTTGDLTGLNNGWQNTIPTGSEILWAGLATAISYDSQDGIPPAEWNISKLAEDGKTIVTSNLFVVSATEPAIGFTQCNQDIATGAVTFPGGNPTGWTNEPPTNTAAGGKIWHITDARVELTGATTSYHPAADYGTPTVISQNGIDGIDGSIGLDGAPGLHGSGSYVIYVSSTAAIPSTDAGKDANVAAIAGRPAQEGDIVTYQDYAATFSQQYIRGSFAWTAFTLVIDGNAIVNGTIAGYKLQAATVTGDRISASTTISAGTSGTNYAAMSGTAGHGFWAGSSSDSTAPFRVRRDGYLVASNANITGNVNATSGTFSGSLNVNSGGSSRLEIISDRINVYESGVLRVRIGRL